MAEIDKSRASLIGGTPGVKYKVDGVRYNARWEEMEFVSVGENEGDADIYRVKKKVGRPRVHTIEENPPRKNNTLWTMSKGKAIKELEKLGVEFDLDSNKNTLLVLLKKAREQKTGLTKNDVATR